MAALSASRMVLPAFRLLGGLLGRLPDPLLDRIAELGGAGLSLVWRRRRALVRANLERVVRWLDARGMATPTVARAARDQGALDRLVRAAFGHYVRSYLETILAPGYDVRGLRERVTIETPELAAEALAQDPPGPGRRGRLFVTLHFGALELPALYAVGIAGMPITAPMETVANPALQEALVHARGASGVRIVPFDAARDELRRALGRGEGVALVADRLVRGSGVRVELFGAPARLPLGPASLALETGASTWTAGMRRTGPGRYSARLERLEIPAAGSRRERLQAFLDGQARAFERMVAGAPEQWWTLFFPIWPDLDAGGASGSRPDGATDGSRPDGGASGSRPFGAADGSRPDGATDGSRPATDAGVRPEAVRGRTDDVGALP